MADKTLRVRYTGDTSQLQASQKQVASGTQQLGATFKQLAGAVGIGFGISAVVSFGKEIISAANAAQESNNRLQAAAKGTSIDVQQVVKDFADLGLASAQDDEMLKDLASTLLRMGFKGSTAELEAEVQAITDLGAATSKGSNIITRFFVALNSGNLGKAITSAKTLGLVTQQQAEHFVAMTKAGRGAEVQQKLLTIAQTRGHGAAAAQATQLDILINLWEEFKEDLGKLAIDELEKVYTGLHNIAVALQDVGREIQYFTGLQGSAGEGVSKFSGAIEQLAAQSNSTFPYIKRLYDIVKAFPPSHIAATAEVHKFSAAEDELVESLKPVPDELDKQSAAMERSKAKTKDWLKNAIGAFDQMSGGLTGVKRAWELTSTAAETATRIIAEKQRTIAKDLKELGNTKIGDGIKNQLIALGPDMVHAYIQGSPKQRQAIRGNLQEFNKALRDTNGELKTQAHQMGVDVSHGTGDGITEGSGYAASAAGRMADRVLATMRAKFETASPSKATKRIAKDLVQGLIDGFTERQKDLTKAFEQVGAQLDKLEAKAKSFKDGIKSGFSELANVAGAITGLWGRVDEEGNAVQTTAGDIAFQIQRQVDLARDLAFRLKQAAAAGLSQENLAAFAAQGYSAVPALQQLVENPELIEQLNEATAQIAQAAGSTANAIGNRFFGAAIERAREKLHNLADKLDEFITKLRTQIAAHADQLGDALRELIQSIRQAVQAQQQNLNAGNGNGNGGGNNNRAPNVTVNVNGSVIAQEDLTKAVRRAAQQSAPRNAYSTGFA